jgi:hypothetical protein
MYSVNAALIGLAPLLLNRFVDTAVLKTRSSGGATSDEARIAAAKEKVYRNDAGVLVLPNWTVKKMLLDGAFKSKRKVAKTPLREYVAAYIFIDGECSFGVKEVDRLHECVGRIRPRTGAAAIIRRPQLDSGWKLAFRLSVLNDALPDKELCEALKLAGLQVGIGSWRPEYGRFEVTQWEVGNGNGAAKRSARSKAITR